MASCDPDVLSNIVQHSGRPVKKEVQFIHYDLAALAQWQLCSRGMKTAVNNVLRQTKTLNIAYPPDNTSMVSVNGHLVRNAKLSLCARFIVSQASFMAQIEFPHLSDINSFDLIRLTNYTSFCPRTLCISESWKFAKISASLNIQRHDSSTLNGNDNYVIRKPFIPDILALRIVDPENFNDESYHATKAVKMFMKAGYKANCLAMIIDSLISDLLLLGMFRSLEITELKWNWKISGNCRPSERWPRFLNFARSSPLPQISYLKVNAFSGPMYSANTKTDFFTAFSNLKEVASRGECQSVKQLIHCIGAYIARTTSVTISTKVVLQLKTSVRAMGQSSVDIDAEVQGIFHEIVSNFNKVATFSYIVGETFAKIKLKATNRKLKIAVLVQTREQGNFSRQQTMDKYYFGSFDNDFIAVDEGGPFPHGAVKAMHRSLQSSDPTMVDSYVAHAIVNGESTFGRAFNREGKVKTVFSYGGCTIVMRRYHCDTLSYGSDEVTQLKILTHNANQEYEYVWLQEEDGDGQDLERVDIFPRAPCVFRFAERDNAIYEESLGKRSISVSLSEGWSAVDGREIRHRGSEFRNAYQLFVKPLNINQ